MNSRGLLLGAVALAVLAVAGLLFLTGDDKDPGGDGLSGGGAATPRTPGTLRAGESGQESRTAASGTDAVDPATDGTVSGRAPLSPALVMRRDQMLATVAEMDAALAVEREVEDAETELEEKIREEAWSHKVEEIKGAVRSIPAMADALYDHIDDVDSHAMAIRMARMLRSASHPEFVQRIRSDAVDAKEPRRRRMAVAALEMRDAEVFLEPVGTAFTKDPDPGVRDEAADVLARSMMDRKHIRSHIAIRTTLQSALASTEPADRSRAVRALMADTRAGPAELDRIRALENDEDPGVRREVVRAIRVLTPRVERSTKRK